MSASTIARWDAIPMAREPEPAPSHKRSRSVDDDDSSEDNVSLVSRSPSPQPDGDVEMKDVYSYDEHVPGVAREVITVETRIKNTNKGFAMLAKMGWTEGTPLGISGDGRIDPVPFSVKQDSTGLGKVTQDFRMIETTVSQRRNLDSERMRFETVEQRQEREAAVAQKAAVRSEISNVLRPFYCELCDKQFKNVAQYDEHTNSYAHHHRARARDMNANHPVRAGGREEAERRKEKERKREEKELRKLAKAAGIKISAPPVAGTSIAAENKAEPKGFKKSGWASVGDTSVPATTPSGGWARASDAPPAPPENPLSPPPPSSGPAPPPLSAAPNNGFRSGGWSTLATSSVEIPPSVNNGGWTSMSATPALSAPLPAAPSGPPPPPPSYLTPPPPSNLPPPPPPQSFPPLPPSNLTKSEAPSLPNPSHSQPSIPGSGKWDAIPPTDSTNPPPPPSPSHTQSPLQSGSTSSKSRHKQKSTFDEAATAQSRGNWQNFQKMRGRR